MRIDEDLWPQVRLHAWKWQMSRRSVSGIIWHATRSGIPGRTAAEEYQSAKWWFASPNNCVLLENGTAYGGIANYLIGGGRILRAVPEDLVPTYSAGVHDFVAISIEVAQATAGDPFDPRDIALCHELADELARRYGFPRRRIPFVDAANTGWPGEVGHEDTAQGRRQGKTDPGPRFWEQYQQEAARMATLDDLLAVVVGNGIDAVCRPGTEDLFPPGTPPIPWDDDGPVHRLTGAAALEYAKRTGISLALGLQRTQRALGAHLGEHRNPTAPPASPS
ncbi:MAG: N-acetylmuramoyl-L-alanine amidase [Dehalococcoidia bacterium]|nr:N-acetylmuramoyl-L-alanine amidase [Dehalococcoidia bacterium]